MFPLTYKLQKKGIFVKNTFMQNLLEEAMNHRAVRHPYLERLQSGSFNNMEAVIKDFATQYGAYSAWFPRYLTGVISKLENPTHRNLLMDNLAEETGHLHDEDIEELKQLGIEESWVQGIPHPQLFRRFQDAMNVNRETQPGFEVQVWRELFLGIIQQGNAAEAVGAIGIGTESVVKFIYKYIIDAIRNHTKLSLEQYVFFPLHTEVDDEHGLILLNIASEMAAENEYAAQSLRKGMLKALNIRASYWDDMLDRAEKL